jgi:hypothetical protein
LSVADAQEDVIIENLIENIGADTYSSPEIDIIEYYRNYPMNLRLVSPEELSVLPGISYINAVNILKLVKENPEIKNYKIADLAGLTAEVEILLDNCTINMNSKQIPIKKGLIFRSRFSKKLEDAKGYLQDKYLGTNDDLYNRLVAFHSEYEMGLVLNKNAGEPDFKEFTSAYLRYENSGTKIIIGDFFADYGMGSILWRQFAARKGSDVISPVMKVGSGISPFRSTIDAAFFRGITAQTALNITSDINLNLSGFFSDRNKSATYDSTLNEITSIYSAGYYRTENEQSKRNKLNEKALGTNMELNFSDEFLVGISGLNLNYSIPINSESSSAFSGENGTLKSIYSSYKIDNNFILAEYAIDAENNKLIRGGIAHSSKIIDIALSGRYIEKEFRSPYGYHFGEFSSPANEKGIYTGILIKPSGKLFFSFFADIFSSIGRTYIVPGITRGLDLFFEANYKPDNNTTYSLRLRRDAKTDLFNDLDDLRLVGQSIRNSIRFEISKRLIKDLNLRVRSEYVNFENINSHNVSEGLASFADLRYIVNKNLKIGLRYSIFSTDDFSSAVYQYEYTMPGIMQTSALYGNGSRMFLLAEYSFDNILKVNANIFSSNKNNTESLGSGNEQINTNYETKFTLQLEFKL